MKKTICVFCMIVVVGFGLESGFAASGKCTVVKVEGERMVIDCDKKTKGFAKGTKIKIKTNKKQAVEGC